MTQAPHEKHRLNMVPTTLYTGLMLAGAMPFLVAVIAAFLGNHQLPVLGSIEPVLISYTFGIVSFMLGALWGIVIRQDRQSLSLLLLSNLMFLLAWFCLVIDAPVSVLYAVFIYIFAKLLWIDKRLRLQKLISAPYFRMRAVVTLIVCLSLAYLATR